jgi:hypothetical protein
MSTSAGTLCFVDEENINLVEMCDIIATPNIGIHFERLETGFPLGRDHGIFLLTYVVRV